MVHPAILLSKQMKPQLCFRTGDLEGIVNGEDERAYPDANFSTFCIKSEGFEEGSRTNDYDFEVFSKIFILIKPQRSNLSRITSRLY